MTHKIELQAVLDSKGISKGVRELSSIIDSSFKQGADIFSPETINFLKGEGKTAVNNLNSSMQSLRKEAMGIDKQLKEGVRSEVQKNKLVKDRLAVTKQMATAERDLANLGKQQRAAFPEQKKGMAQMFQNMGLDKGDSGYRPKRDTSKLGAIGKGVGGAAATVGGAVRSPVVSGAMGAGKAAVGGAQAASAAGMGMGAMTALGGLALVAGGAALAIGRMSAAADVFKESLPQQLQLEAIDGGINNRGLSKGAGLGFDPSAVASMQVDLAKSMGAAPTARGGANRLEQTMLASRELGIDPQEITQGAGQLRQVGGTDGASKGMSKILSKAMSDGMDDSQSSFFLSSAVGLLTDLNKNGMTNSDAMLNAMTDLVKDKSMSPEMAAKSMKSMNESISGSSGESNMFFQTAAARGMTGANSMHSTSAMVSQGLVGMDRGNTAKMLGGSESADKSLAFFENSGLFDENYTKNFAQSITGEMSSKFGDSKEGQGNKLGFIKDTFGTKDFGESAKVLSLLEKLGSGKGTKADEAKLKEFTKDADVRWQEDVKEQLKTIAGATTIIAASSKQVQFVLGKESQEAIFNPLKAALLEADKAILGSGLTTPIGTMAKSVEGLAKSINDLVDGVKNSAIGKMLGLGGDEAKKKADKETFNSMAKAGRSFMSDEDKTLVDSLKTKRQKKQLASLDGQLSREITPKQYQELRNDTGPHKKQSTKFADKIDRLRELQGLTHMMELQLEATREGNKIAADKNKRAGQAPRTTRAKQ